LQRAIDDAYGAASDIPQHEKRAAQIYIRNNNTREFGFIWCCSVLEIDPEVIRSILIKMFVAKKGNKKIK
jgi:hypothetical protein